MIITKKQIKLIILIFAISIPNIYSQNVKEQLLINTQKIQNTDNQFIYLKQKNDAEIEMMNAKIETINKQLNSINENNKSTNNRIDQQQNLLLGLYGSIIALLAVIIGMVLWERTNLTKPLYERIERLEEEVKTKLSSELKNKKK